MRFHSVCLLEWIKYSSIIGTDYSSDSANSVSVMGRSDFKPTGDFDAVHSVISMWFLNQFSYNYDSDVGWDTADARCYFPN